MNQICWEHGFKRFTAVVSCISAILFVIFILNELGNHPEDALHPLSILIILGLLSIFVAIPWILFYLVRFIIRGFLSS